MPTSSIVAPPQSASIGTVSERTEAPARDWGGGATSCPSDPPEPGTIRPTLSAPASCGVASGISASTTGTAHVATSAPTQIQRVANRRRAATRSSASAAPPSSAPSTHAYNIQSAITADSP